MRNYLLLSKLPQTKEEEWSLTRQTYLAASRGQTLSGRNEQLKLDQTLASLSDCCAWLGMMLFCPIRRLDWVIFDQ